MWDQVAESEDTFHRSLVDALGNFRLSVIFGSYMDEVQLHRTQIRNQPMDLGNRINASLVGVSSAVFAYNNGQQDMAAAYQSELVKSAQSGDFSYFVQHQATGGTP